LWQQAITTGAQQIWLVKLLGYDFIIKYKKGVENVVIDTLSRRADCSELAAISHPIPQSLEPIKEVVATHKMQELVRKIQVGSTIYLEENSPLIPAIVNEYHSSTHEGFHKTLHRVQAIFLLG
jgi:hypothetical protein